MNDGSLVNSNFTTDHVLTLLRLQPGTEYLIRVESVDAAGNVAMTEIGKASTAPTSFIRWSAEDGTFAPPLRIWSSPDAIGDACVAGMDAGGSVLFPVLIDVPSNYVLWCRLRSPVQDDWAFKLLIDGEKSELPPVGGDRTGELRRWMPLMKRSSTLGIGLHELRVDSLVAGVVLDEFILTNDPDWHPVEVEVR